MLNYNTCDKKFYALAQALKQWYHSLLKKKVILRTDHQPLQFSNSQSKTQEHWHLKWNLIFNSFIL